MFWKNIYTPSRIDTLLDSENVTLEELMDEEDVMTECKSSNKKLIDFLAKPEIIESLVKMVLDEPIDDVDDKQQFKYSNIACELITSDVSQITDILASSDSLVNSLFSFLEREEPLNPLQASFVSKIMGLLISRKSDAMLEFIKCRDGFLEHVLHHVGTSAIMDLLLRLITCIDATECRNNCINWLSEQKLVQRLIALVDSSETVERNTNAAQTLCDIIRLGKDAASNLRDGPYSDALLLEVEKSDSVSTLLGHMLKDVPNESVIVNGLYVLQALMEPKRTSDLMHEQSALSDVEYLGAVVSSLSFALIPRLKDFHHLLLNPPKQHYTPMPTSLGPLLQPLGLTRLQVATLIATLVAAENSAVNSELASLCTIGLLLDLFFQYPFNNFLHTQVERCLASIIASTLPENPLLSQLIKDFKLLEKIVAAFEENQDLQVQSGKQRQGHLGHLTRIANLIASKVGMGSDSHSLSHLFEELSNETQERWKIFVGNLLCDTNKLNAIELGGGSSKKNHIPSSSDDDDDFSYSNFIPDDNLQKAFADYQIQQMTNNFVEQFGFSEDDFSEQDENICSPFMSKLSNIDFELNMIEDNPTAAAMFEQACNDRIRQFDSTDSDEEWEKEIYFTQSTENRLSNSAIPANNTIISNKRDNYYDDEEEEEFVGEDAEDSEGSSDSEEELSSPLVIKQTYKGQTEEPVDEKVESIRQRSPGQVCDDPPGDTMVNSVQPLDNSDGLVNNSTEVDVPTASDADGISLEEVTIKFEKNLILNDVSQLLEETNSSAKLEELRSRVDADQPTCDGSIDVDGIKPEVSAS